MKSLVIMFAGLGICAWGFSVMWEQSVPKEGFAAAKIHYILGALVFFIGAIVNHWEHTRRGL
jgi:protein-S-isoprenylcysteine O-methyltransferase Ste14